MFRPIVLLCLLLVCASIAGVFASWEYTDGPPEAVKLGANCTMNEFRYGTLYITNVSVVGGSYSSATPYQVGDLNMQANIELNRQTASSVVMEVTFYNNTHSSFYYNKTETVSWNNDRIDYTVTGIEKQDEIAGYSYKTIQLTFAYAGKNVSASSLLFELHFNFVVDKDSIGDIVAMTAVDRFKDVLNNKVSENAYQTLEDAMDNRSGWNKASAVTYIGNVAGSSSADSNVLKSLFGNEFMSMDLDGDGVAEPITMMIKRENLDGDTTTGDSYTYTTWREEVTVEGVEMTLYITSANLSNVTSGKSVVVYAATYTKLPGSDTWTELVPLTKGAADANNYSGYGSANSFNTDTWLSDTGKSMDELALQSR
jgi:hypothetical protein